MGETKETVAPSSETASKKMDVVSSVMNSSKKNHMNTFVSIGSDAQENDSLIELDLVYVREKGREERFLKIELSGHNITHPERPQQYAIKVVNSKEEFDKLKNFFAQLEWEK